jgi:hypothetical protein
MPDYRLRIEVEYKAVENTLAALPDRPLSINSIQIFDKSKAVGFTEKIKRISGGIG